VLSQQGLSLVELLVVVIVLSLIVAFNLPLGLSFYQKNHLDFVKEELIAALTYARNRALIDGLPLVLTPLAQANWSAGMRLFVDNEKHRLRPETKLLHQWHWNYPGLHLSWQGLQSKRYLLFPADLNQAAANGHFIIQNAAGSRIKLTLNRLGRVRESQR
jgi:prepilin-type N-terminal cleavage/methylation domain-containing protein